MAIEQPLGNTEEILASLNNEETRSALTATPQEFTGGVFVEAIREAAEVVPMDTPDPVYSWSEKYKALRLSTVTNKLTQAALDAYEAPGFVDFDPDLDRLGNAKGLLRELGLPETLDNLAVLGQGGTAEDQAELAQRLADHEFNQKVLAQHGGLALATGVVDPVYLVADIATFGATRAFRMGRLASGVVGAGGVTSVNIAADATGQDMTTFDYVLSAALTGGAFSLFGGDAANRIADGTGNWYGAVSPVQNTGRSTGTVPPTGTATTPDTNVITRFFSEADTAFPTPEAKALGADLIDDPLIREGFSNNNNAAALRRRTDNELEGIRQEYDDFVEQYLVQDGFNNILTRTIDIGGQYSQAKSVFQREVAAEMLRRNDEFLRFGYTTPGTPGPISEAADLQQKLADRVGRIAQSSGLPGFEDFTPQPGYFHRVWDGAKMRGMGPDTARQLVREAVRAGIRGIDPEDARAISRAIVDRAVAKEAGQSVDFAGALGRADTDAFIDLLREGGLQGADLDSAISRLESLMTTKGLPKAARSRLPLDMSVSIVANGRKYSMVDLIDTDLDRVSRNYAGSMSGRSALAKAGIGGDDKAIQDFRKAHITSLGNLPKETRDAAIRQLDAIIGDFTGAIPDANRLTPNLQRLTAYAQSTQLLAQGLNQAMEYGTIAHRFGAFQTYKEMLKRMPGVRQLLRDVAGDKDLADEVSAVLDLDLARDVRFHPWIQQYDEFELASNTWVDRLLHAGKQALPFLTAQKYVHAHQTRMAMNLALQKVGKAMQGKKDALQMLQEYAPNVDWAPVLARNNTNVTRIGNTIQEMNWASWDADDVDTVINVVLRMIDDSVLKGRTGQGTAFARSTTGQVLGQYRSFVGFAHNKLLRGTMRRNGPLSMATILAHQYPWAVLMLMINEARKGAFDPDDDEFVQNSLKKALGYTAGMGFYADLAGVLGLTGQRGGLSVPVTGIADGPVRIGVGVLKQFDDDPYNDTESLYDVTKGAVGSLPVVMGIPGTALMLEALKED